MARLVAHAGFKTRMNSHQWSLCEYYYHYSILLVTFSYFFFLSNFPKPSLVFSNSVTFPWTDIGLRSPEVKRIYVNTFLLAAFWPTGSSPVFSWSVWRALKSSVADAINRLLAGFPPPSSAWPLPTSEAATQTLCHSSPTLPLTDILKHFSFFLKRVLPRRSYSTSKDCLVVYPCQ